MVWIIQDVLFAATFLTALYLFFAEVGRRFRYMKLAAPAPNRVDRTGRRIWTFLTNVVFQKKVMAVPSGIVHSFMFWGFLVLVFGDFDFVAYQLTRWHFPWGVSPVYDFIEQLFTLFVVVAVVVAVIRRYGYRPMRLSKSIEAGVILGLVFFICITTFFVEGANLDLEHSALIWANPISNWFARAFTHMSRGGLWTVREVGFWVHVLCIMVFLYLIPRSKHLHMIASMANWYLTRLDSPGKLSKLDLEDESIEEFGVGKVEDYTWKQLLDGYACIECGRCHINCPAVLSGKPLSPKYLILKMKDQLVATGGEMLQKKAAGAEDWHSESLFENTFSPEEVWSCTTCRACEAACPVANEHVANLMDLRRYLVLTEGEAPAEVSKVFANLERQSNEWGVNRRERAAWTKDLSVRTMKEAGSAEYLFYVGSADSFDARNQKIARAFVEILNKAGVDFAILGAEEESDGDTARRMGNEFLYQTLVEKNLQLFEKYHVQKIITTDPHAYNTFKNEYPDFGFQAEVYHSSEFVSSLLRQGKIRPVRSVEKTVTYHDSCYLGRYNQIYEFPREILRSIPGVNLVEMDRNRKDALCCGAGGGGMFREEAGDRINVLRAQEATGTGAQVICTACPYCMTMMIDGLNALGKDEEVESSDILELLVQSL